MPDMKEQDFLFISGVFFQSIILIMTSRRVFLKNTAITTAGLSLTSCITRTLVGSAPSDRINVGLIGCNGMGFSDLSEFLKHPQVECIAFVRY